MNKNELWNLIRQVMQGISKHYGNAMNKAAISTGLEPLDWLLVIFPAYLFEPDPISVARLRIRGPYSSPICFEEPLLEAKFLGFLDEAPEGGYILNPRGHEAFRKVIDAAYKQMEELSPLPQTKMEELKLLLARLVQASIISPEQTCKWSILNSRKLDPGRNVASMITIDQYLSDLSAYRDDAHLASWSSYSIGAHEWEILGALWQDKASSTAEVIELLKRRRWTENETHEAINVLVRKGWVTDKEKLNLTEEGRNVREDAEELTDKFFFSPWYVLNDAEYEQLSELLTQLKNSLDEIYKSNR